ncbi:hypothetical protein MESS2_440085 [Mesorhizobium metallidurans STM 2683]|uniref:Uncharacterized protein n=1 Tax=Mesorhizobium metallidurans STM 2683 TaxID=1297569 RepID=M5ESH9_9HYPH|nr:hypothetical protein MESS2_440085 [Mesorhizobium metallidurans STM 2683]
MDPITRRALIASAASVETATPERSEYEIEIQGHTGRSFGVARSVKGFQLEALPSRSPTE